MDKRKIVVFNIPLHFYPECDYVSPHDKVTIKDVLLQARITCEILFDRISGVLPILEDMIESIEDVESLSKLYEVRSHLRAILKHLGVEKK